MGIYVVHMCLWEGPKTTFVSSVLPSYRSWGLNQIIRLGGRCYLTSPNFYLLGYLITPS